jgi:hypothetical protein
LSQLHELTCEHALPFIQCCGDWGDVTLIVGSEYWRLKPAL